MSRDRMLRAVIVFLFVVWGDRAIASEDQVSTFVCIEEKSTGFDWKGGDWNYTKFIPEKHIVQRLKVEKPEKSGPLPKSGLCFADPRLKDKPLEFKELVFSYGCYNIRASGTEYYAHTSQVCRETWKVDGKGRKKLDSVDCEHFKFRPNGWFHASRIHGFLETKPASDYKDSLVVAVGKCSML